MKKPLSQFIIFIGLYSSLAFGQQIHEVEFIESVTRQELEAQLDYTVTNGVSFYKMTYHTTGSDGLPDIASGLLVMPDNNAPDYPLLVYHHGTSSEKSMVPSSLNLDYEAYAFFGGNGYLVLAPDYLGMGESRGFHPYMHRETQASASVDMLKAAHEWVALENINISGDLFLTGYSQGGHASMSTHQHLEQYYSEEYPVTAAAHMAGPYSLSAVMKQVMLSEDDYDFPGFIPYFILGFQEVYGTVYNELGDIFRSTYVPHIQSFYDGDTDLTALTVIMILFSQQLHGNLHPVNFLTPSLVEDMQSDENHPLNLLLAENDSYNWVPQAPTRLFYCQGDNLVPAQNTVLAGSEMQANGAPNLQTINLGADLDHLACAEPSMIAALGFFNGFQPTDANEPDTQMSFHVYPNPTQNYLQVEMHNTTGEVPGAMYDVDGRLILQQTLPGKIDMGPLPPGVYILKITTGTDTFTEKIVKH
ncbi:MAG: T9SS type A sorting domain-containing protein [Bacteroidota bacterium]